MTNKNSKHLNKSKQFTKPNDKSASATKRHEVSNAELTAEDIEEKIKELRKLQKQIDPSFTGNNKSNLPSFQTIYIIFEIFMCIAVIGLGYYVYHTSQQRQALINNAAKFVEASKSAKAEEILKEPNESYDAEEFCSSNDDCSTATVTATQTIEDDELESFLES